MIKKNTKLKPKDIEITHVRGSGPGGQNRNKRMSGIRMIHVPTGIVVVATERRSQEQNLSTAFFRLQKKIQDFYYVAPKRVQTKKTQASNKRRLEAKKRRGTAKINRSKKYDYQ